MRTRPVQRPPRPSNPAPAAPSRVAPSQVTSIRVAPSQAASSQSAPLQSAPPRVASPGPLRRGPLPDPDSVSGDALRARRLGHRPVAADGGEAGFSIRAAGGRSVQRVINQGDDVTEGAVTYTTDAFDRPTRAVGTVHPAALAETGRGEAQGRVTATLGALYRTLFLYNASRNAFDGGHLVAHGRGGSAGMANMVPMEKDYNERGGYKIFETSVIDALEYARTQHGRPALTIDMRVDYPAAGLANSLAGLVAADNAGVVARMGGDATAAAVIEHEFRRLPTAIRMHGLTGGGADYTARVTQPTDPRAPLARTTRWNASVNRVLEFAGLGRTASYGAQQGTTLPAADAPAAGGAVIDYRQRMKARYADMQEPGITNFVAAASGLAGGVDAYVWMDPFGFHDKFGGTGTSDVVDPRGADWRVLNLARMPAGLLDPAGRTPYVKGHLLNAKLHGPGHDSRNLVPLTRYANEQMSSNFEEVVKRSAALVDPARGVFWEARTEGLAQRPPDWQRVHAQAAFGAALWDEEARLPRRLRLRAWEGQVGMDGRPQRTATVVADATIPNVLTAGDGGVLGRTVSITANLGQHLVAGGAADQAQGYRTRAHQARGGAAPAPAVPAPDPGAADRLRRHREYQTGVRVASRGEHLYAHPSPEKRRGFDDWWDGYRDHARTARPRDTAWGYREGFEAARRDWRNGWDDGNDFLPRATLIWPAYEAGYRAGRERQAEYDRGVDWALQGGWFVFGRPYFRDGYDDARRGYDDGYEGRPAAPGQDRGYHRGFDRGRQVWRDRYEWGWTRARDGLGVGFDAPEPARRGFREYLAGRHAGYHRLPMDQDTGAYRRGYQDGRDLRRQQRPGGNRRRRSPDPRRGPRHSAGVKKQRRGGRGGGR